MTELNRGTEPHLRDLKRLPGKVTSIPKPNAQVGISHSERRSRERNHSGQREQHA